MDPMETNRPLDETPINSALPSYINISCAVSGYRPLNKYGAPVREGLHLHDGSACALLAESANITDPSFRSFSNMNEIVGSMPHSEDLFKKQMRKWEFWDSAAYGQVPQNSSYCKQSEVHDNNPNKTNNYRQTHKHFVKVDNIPDARLKVAFPYDKDAGPDNQKIDTISSGKSFIQQRIERLYGPSALGVGFRTRRALLELQQDCELRKDLDSVDDNCGGREVSHEYPSVFRHLRPEFRYQLPIKSKIGVEFDSETKKFYQRVHPKADTGQFAQKVVSLDTNCRKASSERVRNIPIQLENGDDINTVKKEDTLSTVSNGTVLPNQASDSERTIEKDSLTKDSLSQEQKIANSKSDQSLDLNSNLKPCDGSQPSSDSKQDGNFFLKIVEAEQNLLTKEVSLIEGDLENHSELMSEEVRGKLLSTVGKVNLLMSQKLKQFIGLCHKNINQSASEEFPTTDEDLAGFWDMVAIQVESVKNLIEEARRLKDNNWKEVAPKDASAAMPASAPSAKSKSAVKRVTKPSCSSRGAKDDARKKALEERRQAMREAMSAKRKEANQRKAAGEDQVEIFLAEK